MKILTISGSNREGSSNVKLVAALSFLFPKQYIYKYDEIHDLPVFQADLDKNPIPENVVKWRSVVKESDAVIICTPEYLHNLPASIKNALEWLTTSGELYEKPTLPITFTPNAPRGEKAMQSLLWSLNALNARVVAQLSLFQTEISFDENGKLEEGEGRELLENAIQLFI